MEKQLARAVVFGAVVIAAALVYHGRQLGDVTLRLNELEQQTGALDHRLDRFSQDLPAIIENAGEGAGRQAVHGVIDEVLHKPIRSLKPRLASVTSNMTRSVEELDLKRLLPAEGQPWIRFDIPEPIVNVEIHASLGELPSWLRRTGTNGPAREVMPQPGSEPGRAADGV